MTRLNLVPPDELTDQHLFAEYREIKMVPRSLNRSLAALHKRHNTRDGVLRALLSKVPPEYVLGTGHVTFFYDKSAYQVHRYDALRKELRARGVRYNRNSALDPLEVYQGYPELHRSYQPTPQALQTARQRIAARVALRPTWYRYRGNRISPRKLMKIMLFEN